MKVLDLECSQGHTFEGWFGSEEDFVSQCERALVQCPMCADAKVTKKLSAPRLNLSNPRESASEKTSEATTAVAAPDNPDLTSAWMAMARAMIANTSDVGNRFAEEARKIHYGEVPEHGIRGQATAQETRDLLEEGIAVMPLVLPDALKEPLQ
jgi:hypothetical protein